MIYVPPSSGVIIPLPQWQISAILEATNELYADDLEDKPNDIIYLYNVTIRATGEDRGKPAERKIWRV
jgi:hypothetical protein